MEQDLLAKAMKTLLDLKNNDKEDFLQDFELAVHQLYSDVDQELKTLTLLSDTNHDFGPEIENRTNWLRQVRVTGNNLNSAVESLENRLVDAKVRTSELRDVLAEKLKRLEECFYRAPISFNAESLDANIRVLSEVIEGYDQRICDEKAFTNDNTIKIKESASSDPIRAWIPQLDEELAEAKEIKEVIRAANHEITKIDDELKKIAE